MKKTNTELRRIMTRAHAMTRDTLRAYPEADYRATFSAALRLAWAGEDTAAAAWEAMTEDERAAAVTGAVYSCSRKSRAESDKRGEFRVDWFDRLRGRDDLQGVISEAYIRVLGYLEREPYAAKPLGVVLWIAAQAAARYIARAEIRHASAIRFSDVVEDSKDSTDDGRSEDAYIISNAAPVAEPIAPSPEDSAILSDTLESICRDNVDRQIIKHRAEGYSNREIAARLNVSHTAVNKRFTKLLERYKTVYYSDNYAAGLSIAN